MGITLLVYTADAAGCSVIPSFNSHNVFILFFPVLVDILEACDIRGCGRYLNATKNSKGKENLKENTTTTLPRYITSSGRQLHDA